MILFIQFLVLLSMILIGSRMKGIGLGVMGVVGLSIFVFIFQMKPGDPPIDVMIVIMTIVTTAAALQACGGLDYLVSLAERIIRSNPSNIVFIGPFTVYFFCLFAGTAHLLYSLLPIISEVAAKKRIRPERPLSMSVIASHMAITGSPMSAATAAFAGAGILGYPGALVDIMKYTIPACMLAILIGCFSVLRKGKDLDQDPEFLEKMKDPAFAKSMDSDVDSNANTIGKGAKISVIIFTLAVGLIVLFGAFPSLLPVFEPGEANLILKANGELQMVGVISMITLSASALMLLITKTSAVKVTQTSLFTSMATAVVSVFGVVWMSKTFIDHNMGEIKSFLSIVVDDYPWTFAFAVFVLGALMFSQAATTKTMMPLGMALGISNPALIAIFPAVNADFVLPGYPTLLAAINFDRTGTTKIGKYVFNHSFMLPGLVTVISAIALGFLFIGLY